MRWAAFEADGDHRRFVQDDAAGADVDERVGGAEVDGEVVGEILGEKPNIFELRLGCGRENFMIPYNAFRIKTSAQTVLRSPKVKPPCRSHRTGSAHRPPRPHRGQRSTRPKSPRAISTAFSNSSRPCRRSIPAASNPMAHAQDVGQRLRDDAVSETTAGPPSRPWRRKPKLASTWCRR